MAESDYEFDAPRFYFDLSAKTEPDDTYFDCGKGSGPYKLQTPLVQSSATQPLRSSSRHNAGTPKRALDGITPKRPASFKTPKREPVASRAPAKAPKEEDESKENVPQNDHYEKSAKKRKSSVGSKSEPSPSVGVRSSPRLAAIAKAVRRSNAARRSSQGSQTSPSGRNGSKENIKSRRSSGTASRKSSDGVGSNLTGVSKQRTSKSSMPKVTGMRGLSQEEISELENIATVKHKVGSNKNRGLGSRPGVTVPQEFSFATNSRLKKKPEDSEVTTKKGPLKAVHNGPTKPQEFHFATDSRVKKRTLSEGDEDAAAFPNTLRCGSTTQLDKELPKGPTIPQPFNLTETRKASNAEANKFVSVAELNLKFHTRTPQRFRSKSSVEPEVPVQQNSRHKVTIPVTPNFTTRARSRQTNYMTREEMEQKQFEEEQKHMFKAHPVNKKIFEPPAEVLQAQRKKSTVPEPFNITKSKKEDAPLGSNFKEMCTNLGFSTSSLASLPWGGVPNNWKKTSTAVKPFSFDSRDKDKLQKKKEKIQKIIEDEKKQAEFHAQPMPIFEEGIQGVPQKKPQTPTRVKPFHLRSDEKGEIKREEMKRRLEEEERLDRERRTFHAQSDAVLHQQPFIPEKSTKAPTEISGFTLNTEVRSEARADFELHQKMKEDELLAAKREREERAAKEEEEEVSRLRREAVHKANPVRHFKPVQVKPSENPLTVPVSPNFATKTRLRNRINMSVNSTMDLSMNVSSATFTTE